jgi:hypothetical protein
MFARSAPRLAAVVFMTLAVGACAQTQTRQAPAPGLRVQVETQAEWTNVADVAARVSQIAGLPVRDAGASTTRLFAMTLICPDEATCNAGLQRLIDARDVFTQARIDARRTIPRPIAPSASSSSGSAVR